MHRTGVSLEQHERRPLELDRHLGHAARQPLAGTQIEGDARPPPVVDEELASRRTSRCVTRMRRSVPARVAAVLRAHACRAHLVSGQSTAIACSTLHLLVAHVFGVERNRRLHRDERQQLEHVVLHDVAQRARLVVVRAAAARHPTVFGDGHLHVIDVPAVPDRLEDAVGEPEREDVLDRLLSEVVIDAVDLRLAEPVRSSALSARALSRS